MKRILPGLIAAALIISALVIRAFAAEIFFIAENNVLMPLRDGEMPYRSGGVLYMPYTAFRGGHLGVYYAYNSVENFLTVYNADHSITFYLDKGNAVYDRDQLFDQFNQRAVKRGGIVFVPVSFVCDRLGLTYSEFESSYGSVLRLKSRANLLSDQRFLEAAGSTFAEYYKEYQNLINPTTLPTQPPHTITPPTSAQTTAERPRPVYVTFDGAPGEYTERILDVLESRGVKAAFFLDGSEIEKYRDSAARIAADGHFIGIRGNGSPDAFYESSEAMLRELELANAALFQATGARTRVVRPPKSGSAELSPGMRDALAAAGYRYWDYDVDSGDLAANASGTRIINTLKERLDRRQTSAVLLFHDCEVTSGALSRILDYLTENGRQIRTVSETEIPVNFNSDIW